MMEVSAVKGICALFAALTAQCALSALGAIKRGSKK